MMILNKKNIVTLTYSFLLLSLSALACSSSVQQYRKEATDYCALFKPENWQDKKQTSALKQLDDLGVKTRQVIKSKAFLAIFDDLAKSGYTDFYTAIQPRISKLIGKPWHCEDAKNFSAIKWERKSGVSSTGKITFTITKDRFFIANDKKLRYTDSESIKKALNNVIYDKSQKVILKVPENFSDKELRELFKPFQEMGIKHLSVIFSAP